MTYEDVQERRRVRLEYVKAVAKGDEEARRKWKARLVELMRREMEESHVSPSAQRTDA